MSQFIEMFGNLCQDTPWSDVVTITNGKAYPEEYQEEGAYPICGSGGIMRYGKKKLCNGNTTILGRKGNINNPIFMESGYWIVDTAFSIDVDKAKLHPKFFYYWCCQYDFTKLNKQGVLPSLTRKDLEKVKMAIPQMRDQLKFVSIAEQVDKSKFGDFKSQFIEMIHGCKHVPLNKVARFSKTSITPTSGTVYTLFSFPAFDNDCTPEVVDGSDIKSSKIKLEEDVILYNKLNVRLSRVWNIEKLSTYNNICSSEFMPIKVMGNDVILKSFLYRVLCSDYVTKKMVACSTGTSNSQKRIAPTSLLNLGIPVPTLEQQNQFVSIAQQADKSKFELKQCIENIDKVIKSLING